MLPLSFCRAAPFRITSAPAMSRKAGVDPSHTHAKEPVMTPTHLCDEWYSSFRWRRRRTRHLRGQPFCQWCLTRGYIAEADVVLHVKPHRGNPHLFWNGELISLCEHCHDADL